MNQIFSDDSFKQNKTISLLQESIRRFAYSEIKPIAAEIDKTNTFPKVLWKKMGELGLLGITVDAAYGGAGLGYYEHVIAMEEISRASASVGLSYGAHSNLCVNQIYIHGTESQKNKYLPSLCSGESVGGLAMSETGAGSDVMNLQLRAEKKNNKFCLNGSKMWITNGPTADVLVVYARTSPNRSHGITAFIIEKNFVGFSTAQKLNKLGMRGSDTSELVFENCLVPEENILGEINKGAEVLMQGLDYERLILAAGPVGIMQACIDLILPYVRERYQFGKAIGEFQLMQARLADIYIALESSRAWLYALALDADNNDNVQARNTAGIILFSSERAAWVASQTIQCLGANGYINDFPAERFYRDAKLYEIGAGTSDIRRIVIGRQLFDMEKIYD